MSLSLIVDRTLNRFITSKSFYYIYPLILLFGIVTTHLTTPKDLKWAKNNWYYVSSKNEINQLFAYQGNTIFLILFIGLFISKIIILKTNNHESIEEKSKTSNSSNTSILSIFKRYFIRFVLKFASLLLLFHIIDLIFLKTGGGCQIQITVANTLADSSRSLKQCSLYNGTWVRLKNGFCLLTPEQLSQVITSAQVCSEYGKWIGGFDVSGHFCFLTSISLILWNELNFLNIEDLSKVVVDVENQSVKNKHVSKSKWSEISVVALWKWLVLLTILIWGFILVVTSIFYHTIEEKITGLILGYIPPLVIYFIIPNVPILQQTLY